MCWSRSLEWMVQVRGAAGEARVQRQYWAKFGGVGGVMDVGLWTFFVGGLVARRSIEFWREKAY